MGQEYGHAYEDLLDLALSRILPSFSLDGSTSSRFRVSPDRKMQGVTGTIDHLIEICDVGDDGEIWKPFLLFMEKHSDSANESKKSFRRHLEEYVQVKVASIQFFAFPEQAPLRVINLIYGKDGGWKDAIIRESRRLIYPTLYLPDEPFYEGLSNLIEMAISQSSRPYIALLNGL